MLPDSEQPGRLSQAMTHRRTQIGPVTIAHEEMGQGEPLLLVHGLSASRRWWAKNVPGLAERFRVYSIDLIGFGESRDRHPFILSEAAGYLVAWMDRLEIGQASLVGHSMGGFIAVELAADYPQRVEHLVLVDAAVLPFARGHLRHALGLTRALRYTPIRFLPVLARDAYRCGPATLWRAARELLTTDIRPKLNHVDARTLVVWGEHDTVVPLEIGRRLTGYLPNAELKVVPGAGHNPMWDRPEAFNRLVCDFLDPD